MYSERRWLLAIVMSVMLAVTMLFNPTFVMAAEETGDGGSEDEAITFVNSDGSEIEAMETDDGFIYQLVVNSDGNDLVKILGYRGGSSVIDVPTKINGYKVMSFAIDPRNPGVEGTSYDSITKIKFPKYLEFAHSNWTKYFKNLKAVTVADGNELFKAEDGVMFRNLGEDEGYRVELYPRGKTNTSWIMPDYVTMPYRFFYDCPIEELTLSSRYNIEGYDCDYIFGKLESLKSITVPSESGSLSSIEGVLFNKDQTELLYYPPEKDGDNYIVPATVTRINDGASRDNNYVKTITLPENIDTIAPDALTGFNYLTAVEFTGMNPPESAYNFKGVKNILGWHDEFTITYPDDADKDAYEAFIAELRSEQFAPIPDKCEVILLDEEKDVDIAEPGQVVTFEFTPDEDGDYYFESIGDFDTKGCVMTEDEVLGGNDDYDDHSGNWTGNFRVYFHGNAGITYYLQAKMYSDSQMGTFTVRAASGKEILGFAEIPENPASLEFEIPKETTITEPGQIVTYAFTPDLDGEYYFESTGDCDTMGCVVTEEEFIGEGDNSYKDEEGEESPNFNIRFTGNAGVTYYLQAKIKENETGSFDVVVTGETIGFAKVPESVEALQLNDTKIVDSTKAGQVTTFMFTPEESGYYNFGVNSETEEFVINSCIFTDGYLLVRNDSEDDGWGYGFSVPLDGGTTYYFQTKYYNVDATGQYSVQVTEGEEYVCTEHNLVKEEGNEPTCNDSGTIEYWRCEYCGKIFGDSEGVEEITYEETGLDPLGHNAEKVTAKEATCEEPGNITYWYCDRCEKFFGDKYCYDELSEDEIVIPTSGHNWDKGVVTEGSCTEGGIKTYTCTECGATKDEAISAQGHNMKHFPAAERTCTKDGNLEYWKCKICGNCYLDEEGNTVTTEDEVVLESEGHEWDEGKVIQQATCEEDGEMMLTCKNNPEHTRIQYVPATGHAEEVLEYAAPTCTEPGLTEGSKCSVCGEMLIEQEEIPATGHTEEVLEYVAPTCTDPGLTEGSKCSVCGEMLIEQEEIPATGHTEVVIPGRAATCTESGLTEGKECSVCGATLVEQKEDSPALGHKFGEWEIVESTCQEKGSQSHTCTVCGITETENLELAAHTPGEYVVVEPTCGVDGSRTQVCAVCGTNMTSETIPATGEHAWDNGTVTREATCTEPGEETFTCTVCNATKTDAITVPHKMVLTARVPATLTAPGNIEYWTCSDCNQKFNAEDGTNPVSDEAIIIACPDPNGYAFATVPTYNGKAQKPKLTITDTRGAAINAANYEVSYTNNVNAGTAKAAVKFKGNYSGEKALTFKINKAKQSITVKFATKTLKVKKLKKKAQTITSITKVKKQGGVVTYKKLSGSAKLTVNKKTGKVTVKKKTKKGTYKAKIRVTSASNKNYNTAYKDVTITVKVKK